MKVEVKREPGIDELEGGDRVEEGQYGSDEYGKGGVLGGEEE